VAAHRFNTLLMPRWRIPYRWFIGIQLRPKRLDLKRQGAGAGEGSAWRVLGPNAEWSMLGPNAQLWDRTHIFFFFRKTTPRARARARGAPPAPEALSPFSLHICRPPARPPWGGTSLHAELQGW